MKKKTIIGLAALIVIIGILAAIASQYSAIEVNAEKVRRGNISSYVEEFGEVKAKDYINIYAPTSAKVESIMVDIGSLVKTGDVLAKLDGQDISRMIEEIDAQRLSILAQYNEAKKPVDSEIIEKLKIEINNMEQRVNTARKNLDDKKILLEAGAISNDEFQLAVNSLDFELGNIEMAKLDLQQLNNPVSSNVLAQYESQLKQLDIQKDALMDSGEDYTIESSIDGTVLFKNIDEGSYLQAGMHILQIANMDYMYIESDLLVGDIVKIEEGSEVIISNKDLDISDIKGQVSKIHPAAFSKVSDLGIEQKRIKIEIEMNEMNKNIKPGYEMDIRIITDKSEDTLTIPENAVFDMDGNYYVFKISDGKAILTQVKTGIESQRQIEILEGLAEGESIILSPDNEIAEGKKVKTN
mgnify:CR=1 FL=1